MLLDAVLAIIAAVGVVGIYSYLIKDTYLFSTAEQITIGGALAAMLISTLVAESQQVQAAGAGHWTLVVPLIIGVLFFARFTKYSWLYRYPLGIVMGVGVGLVFGLSIRAQILDQALTTIDQMFKGAGIVSLDFLYAVIVTVGVLTSLSYFIYTKEQKGALYWTVKVGRIFIMGSFGIQWAGHVLFTMDNTVDNFVFLFKRLITALLGG
jgi:hypothetical protein